VFTAHKIRIGGLKMNALKLIAHDSLKKEMPELCIGDTVKVHINIKEGEKSRIQIFEGTIIAKKHGGIQETFTVRRLSHGCGVEKVFPVHSPAVAKVEVVRKGRVRRAKLYYLRDRVGKAAKVKEQIRTR
jgi:large subunit ribosomal protein L19